MRQFSAILVLALLALSLLSPAFGSNADAGVAACCRRNGVHRCSMRGSMRAPDSSESGFRNNRKCPLYSGFNLLPGHATVTFAPSAVLRSAPFTTAAILKKQAEVARVVSAARAHSKRGPPFA